MAATGITSSERSYCEKVACIPGSVFSVAYRFLRANLRDEVLVLHALTTEIGSIPFSVSDAGIAVAKLGWWQQELTPRSASGSQHPVVRALLQSTVLERLDPEMLNEYISAVAEQASGHPIPDLQALQDLACRIGGAELLMEAGLGESGQDLDGLARMGAAAVLNDMLHHLGAVICGESWWLPLDLRAKHGVTLADLQLDDGSAGLNSSIKTICALALKLLDTGRQSLRKPSGERGQPDYLRHILIRAAVLERRLRKLQSKPARHSFRGVRAAEVFAAWRQAVKS